MSDLAKWFADRDEAVAAPLRAEIERLTGSVSTLRELREWDFAERDRLRARIERLLAVLRAYEQWEADLIMNNRWDGKDGLPQLTPGEYDRLMELQAQRNAALEGGVDG